MKKIAHCIHHTHWDIIWYFTMQDATVQFCYNMKEMLEGFKQNRINDFLLDGQTYPIEEYLQLHPEDEANIKELVKNNKLYVGPLFAQLDCFISSGESVINNLRLGMNTAARLGKQYKVAYIPDSFGHSYDFPKIFNQFDIHDFVITRGVGDEYELGSEFIMESNDGSQLLTCTMISGYGYGCYAFREGTLFSDKAKDYNKISVDSLIERLLSYTTVKNEFVFPLGFDQNPVIMDIDKKIDYYNKAQDKIEFKYTDWKSFCDLVRDKGKGLKIRKGEINSTQYHRIHRSIFSGRSDIKALQDKCERILTYELQPMCSILDTLGIEYDHGLIDNSWRNLLKCQTHSSANLTDETNNYILRETKNVLNSIVAQKTYLCKLMSISLSKDEYGNDIHPLVVFNTLPYKKSVLFKTTVLTKTKAFGLYRDNRELPYVVIRSEKKNNGVLRKYPELINPDAYYYETEIECMLSDMRGLSYEVIKVMETIEPDNYDSEVNTCHMIEDDFYKLYADYRGVSVYDKKQNVLHTKAVYLEDSGDEGDSFDYSYPDNDMVINDYFEDAKKSYLQNRFESSLTLKGSVNIPEDLVARKNGICTSKLGYEIKLSLNNSGIINVTGTVNNQAKAHRVRLVFTTDNKNEKSYAGSQYSIVERDTNPEALQHWKQDGWFEEPSAQWPLLNHVSSIGKTVTTVYTRGPKEYEFIGKDFKDMAIVLFRSYGAMAYPDLNRRPGRPSGLDYRIFETPDCYMLGDNSFELGLGYQSEFNSNRIFKNYVEYATDAIAFEGQNFDKSKELIMYFPTNPLENTLPDHYSLMELEGFEGVYGTLVKSDTDNSLLLRVFNGSDKKIKGADFVSQLPLKYCITDLSENKIGKEITGLLQLGEGQLVNIRIEKEEN